MTTATTTTLRTTAGDSIDIRIDAPADIDSFFVFSMHKAGSTLLNNMIGKVCEFCKIPVVEPEIAEYENGVTLGSLDDSVLELIKPTGYCFGGFRSFPKYFDGFDLTGFKKLLLIRDPRDILVSHYFSQRFSHAIPTGQLGEQLLEMRSALESMKIDDYAVQHSHYLNTKFQRYEKEIFDNNLKLFRYEDVVFEKERWLKESLAFLGINVPKELIKGIAQQVDKRPVTEDPKKHIRKVTPGDHKEKLKIETIEKLNDIFRDVLNRFDYSTEISDSTLNRKCG